MFDFVGAFKRGIKAAKELNKYQLEIDEVFFELAGKFLEATEGEFVIERLSSYVSGVSAALDVLTGTPPVSQVQTSGAIFIRSTNDANKKAKIANWIKHPKGFTFVLQFEQREIISKSKVELGAALEELLSAPVVGKTYLSLLNSSLTDRKEKEVVKGRPLRVVKGSAVAAAKPGAVWAAAKPAAKPAAAKVAAKSAAKPAAAKVAAKPTAKPAASKATAKPAAKPAAGKAEANSAAKPAAPKAALKPTAKKPAAVKPPTAPRAIKPAAPSPASAAVPNADALGDGVNEVKPGNPQSELNPGL
ncbi:hypothetical protein [Pseudomonas sp. B10]|uniref:hypothetical protein n=1 Tax=Pseudomonas sp. B10 TaxID=118613 RepID=UPI0021157634|nr:hypothetical protein [Pseudomonas sp. B10]